MKSAYELTMERLQKNAPSVTLSESQKTEIADIESSVMAKIAEKELFLQGEIIKERARGNFTEMDSLQKQLVYETARIREDSEAKKERVRRQSSVATP